MNLNIENKSVSGLPPAPLNPIQQSFIRLNEAETLRQLGKFDRAQRICEALLRDHPRYASALHTLGLIHADRSNYERALDCLVRAAMHNPSSWATLTALGGVYFALDATEMAAKTMEQARAIRPHDTNVLTTLGTIYVAEREYDLAKEAFDEAAILEPTLMPAAIGLGWAHSSLGQNAEAVKVFERLHANGVYSLDALHGLSEQPAALLNIDILTELQKLHPAAGEDRRSFENTVAFIRASALDKNGRHDDAWRILSAANRAVFNEKERERRERREREQANLLRLRADPIKIYGDDEKWPISLFILGPSRSGKTSMEQLAGALPGVKRGYESPIVDNAVRHTFQTASLLPQSFFEDLPAQLDDECRRLYFAEVVRRAGGAKVFTNTHPAVIYDAARIARSLPNARFILMKRDKSDILLRIYMRKYSQGNSYAYNLKAVEEHVDAYYEMIDLLNEKLPGCSRIVNYEDMVSDPLSAAQIAADLCGLSVTNSVPTLGDDRNCSLPYRTFMAAELVPCT